MSELTLPSPVQADPLDDTVIGTALEFVLGTRAPSSDPSADRSQERVLEVAQLFGDAVLALKHFAPGRAVALGDTLVKSFLGSRPGEDFFVPSAMLPSASHPLFQPDGRGWVCVVDPAWTGTIDGPRGVRTLASGATLGADGLARVPFSEDERLIVDLGTTLFVARAVHPSRRVPLYGGDGIDYPLLGIAGFMGFVAMFLGVALSVVPSPPATTRMDDTDRLVDILLDRPKPPPTPKSATPAEAKSAPKGPSGTPGPKAPDHQTRITKAARDLAAATEAGILGALKHDSALETLLGSTGLPSSVSGGLEGLIGTKTTGTNGFATRPGGWGGDGTAAEMGGFGPIGRGNNSGKYVPKSLGPKDDGDLTDHEAQIITIGSLDRAQIDAVVKRNMSQIRYCYQRELTKNPGLGGKVTVKFVITKDGSVSQAITKSSTLGNPAVESCINGRILRFGFPQPRGGGIVIVNYPFLFSAN